jgi:hypothetical protein
MRRSVPTATATEPAGGAAAQPLPSLVNGSSTIGRPSSSSSAGASDDVAALALQSRESSNDDDASGAADEPDAGRDDGGGAFLRSLSFLPTGLRLQGASVHAASAATGDVTIAREGRR